MRGQRAWPASVLGVLLVTAGAIAVLPSTTQGAQKKAHAAPSYNAVDLGSLGGEAGTDAAAMNADGMVVGDSMTKEGTWHAFAWTRKDGMVDLGTLGGLSSTVASGVVGSRPVNDHGEVIGNSDTPDRRSVPFVWTKHAGMVRLEPPEEFFVCSATAIDDHGRIFGTCSDEFGPHHAVVWTR